MIALIFVVWTASAAAFGLASHSALPWHASPALQRRSEGSGPSQSSGGDSQPPRYHRTLSQLGITSSLSGSVSERAMDQPPRKRVPPPPPPPRRNPNKSGLHKALAFNQANQQNIMGGRSGGTSLRTPSQHDDSVVKILSHAARNPRQARDEYRGVEHEQRRAGGEVPGDSATMKRLGAQSRSLRLMQLNAARQQTSVKSANDLAEEARKEVEERLHMQGESSRPSSRGEGSRPSSRGAGNVSLKGSKSTMQLALKDQKRYKKQVRKRMRQKQKKAEEAEKEKRLAEEQEGKPLG